LPASLRGHLLQRQQCTMAPAPTHSPQQAHGSLPAPSAGTQMLWYLLRAEGPRAGLGTLSCVPPLVALLSAGGVATARLAALALDNLAMEGRCR
jgi:hypothetical protein